MRTGTRKLRTPARIADGYENTLPRLFGGVKRHLLKFIYAALHCIHWLKFTQRFCKREERKLAFNFPSAVKSYAKV